MGRKTVLITGSTRGIGLAFAQYYKARGWNVIATARNLANADAVKKIEPYQLVQLDTTDEDSIGKAAETLKDTPINLLINNAGIAVKKGLMHSTKADLMSQFEVNAVGPYLTSRALLPNLRLATQDYGSAVIAHMSAEIASIEKNRMSGLQGYRASKTALNMLGKCLAVDLKQQKICSVMLYPGMVKTDLTGGKGMMEPEESVAQMAKILANLSPEKDSGRFIHVGGRDIPW